jgi:hypothetical protein
MFKKAMMLGLALAVVSGCAGMRAAQARQSSLQNAMNNNMMTAAPDQVLAMARLVLVERGFAPKDVGQGVLETDPKSSSSSSWSKGGSSSYESWKYVVTAMVVGNGTKLVVMRNSQSSNSGMTSSSSNSKSVRDYEMELEILRRIDPASASRIESDADRAGEAAANG